MFMASDFEYAPAHVVVGAPNRLYDITHWNPEGQEFIGVKVDLILFDKAAD